MNGTSSTHMRPSLWRTSKEPRHLNDIQLWMLMIINDIQWDKQKEKSCIGFIEFALKILKTATHPKSNWTEMGKLDQMVKTVAPWWENEWKASTAGTPPRPRNDVLCTKTVCSLAPQLTLTHKSFAVASHLECTWIWCTIWMYVLDDFLPGACYWLLLVLNSYHGSVLASGSCQNWTSLSFGLMCAN